MNLRFWSPRKIKHDCLFKNFAVLDKVETKRNDLVYGVYGIKALESGLLSFNQVESVRRIVNKYLNRTGKIWIRVRPETYLSKKPIGVRMGKGKGKGELWVAKVRKGAVLFEVGGTVDSFLALDALAAGMHKLPMKCVIIKYSI